jgi:hypothetical protein
MAKLTLGKLNLVKLTMVKPNLIDLTIYGYTNEEFKLNMFKLFKKLN